MSLDHLRERKLSEKQIAQSIRILAAEPRFDAVVQLLDRNREAWAAAACDQKIADSHGKIAHAAGSLHAVNLILAQIDQSINAKEKRGGPVMEPSE